jgi:hypothetical protein
LDYKEILEQDWEIFKIADMRDGKVNDDGYWWISKVMRHLHQIRTQVWIH